MTLSANEQGPMTQSLKSVNPAWVKIAIDLIKHDNDVLINEKLPANAKLVFHRIAIAPIIFAPPHDVSIQFRQIKCISDLECGIHNAMASYAMYLLYMAQKEVNRVTPTNRQNIVPHMYPHGSELWNKVRSKFLIK